MNRRAAGIMLLINAALMRGIKYVAAAIYMSSNGSQSRELFRAAMDYLGHGLDHIAVGSAIAGIAFILMHEIKEFKHVTNNEKE